MKHDRSNGTQDDDVMMFEAMDKFHRQSICAYKSSDYKKRWTRDYQRDGEDSFEQTFEKVGGSPFYGNSSFKCWALRMFFVHSVLNVFFLSRRNFFEC